MTSQAANKIDMLNEPLEGQFVSLLLQVSRAMEWKMWEDTVFSWNGWVRAGGMPMIWVC